MSRNIRLPLGERKQIIKENIAFRKIGERDVVDSISWMCGVDRKTIHRDIKKMEKAGEWADFIQETVLKLSQLGDIDDVTKFREWMKIYSKRFTEKHQVETKGTHIITVTFDKDMKDELKDKLPTPPSTDPVP